MNEDLTAEDVAYGDAELYAWSAQLGWNSPDTESSYRLYALDKGSSPRHHIPPRTLERAIAEGAAAYEGSRAVVVLVGDRYVPDEVLERCRGAAAAAVLDVLRAHARATTEPRG